MEPRLDSLCGPGYAEAFALRAGLAGIALAERNAASGPPSLASVPEYAAQLARRTVCLTLLAGSGSRWLKSLAAAEARGEGIGFDPARPRGLYPVRDFLTLRSAPLGPQGNDDAALGGGLRGQASPEGRIPIASYAVSALRGLGRHLLVVRGWEAEIDEEILAPLGIGPGERDFFTQGAPFGKPLGHGDAAWQCRELLRGADYVVANFGGDANSRRTIVSSLLALDALRSSGLDVDFLLPAAPLDSPAYPIGLDSGGLPRSFGHAKLQGGRGQASMGGRGYTNVGVRVYSAPALVERLESFRSRYWVEGVGYEIPGNDPEGREFALDNVDAQLAAEGRARILAIARPEELTPAKSVDDIPAFERAVESVVNEDAELRIARP
jgi:hypothetical protein